MRLFLLNTCHGNLYSTYNEYFLFNLKYLAFVFGQILKTSTYRIRNLFYKKKPALLILMFNFII